MGKNIKVGTLIKRTYNTLALEGKYLESFGKVEMGSRWLIYGQSGHGKTEFCAQITKELAKHGNVMYLSKEQGDKSSMQECFIRNRMDEVGNKVVLGVDYDLGELLEVLRKRNSPNIIVIDSIDYLEITLEQYKEMSEMFPKKMLILISWAEGKKPKTSIGRSIEYMVDVKIHVERYVAFPKSRYGGNEPYIIWEEKAKQYHSFLKN